MAFPAAYSSFVDNVNTISAADVNNLETTLMITTDRAKFLAYNSATDENVTGNGTFATADLDTEVFDTGADFASDTFTAPVTGKYLLTAAVRVIAIASDQVSGNIRIVTSNRTYSSDYVNPYACSQGGAYTFQITAIADMDAADTATVSVVTTGGSLVADIYGAAGPFTYFAGALLV